MFTGKTSSGFEFSLQDEVLDDYELLKHFRILMMVIMERPQRW